MTTVLRPTNHPGDEPIVLPPLPCGHHGPTNRPCSVCAVFADTPNDEEFRDA